MISRRLSLPGGNIPVSLCSACKSRLYAQVSTLPRADETVLYKSANTSSRSSSSLLLSLMAALLIVPAVLVLEYSQRGVVRDVFAIAAGSVFVSSLLVIRIFYLVRQTEHQADQVRELSLRDELTGLFNRRALNRRLPDALSSREPVSIAIIDLDYFKSYNDRYGHPGGDRLLKAAAISWQSALRRTDMLVRYGGEEFISVLPGTFLDEAGVVLERIRALTPDNQTLSAGVVTWNGQETVEELIARADRALYKAKSEGRDRVVLLEADVVPVLTS